MKIRIEEATYSGSPSRIMEQLLENSFDKAQFSDLESYLDYSMDTFTRMTDIPCKMPKGSLDAKAEALLYALAEIDALEVLDE